MNKLIVTRIVALMFLAFVSQSASAQYDYRPYFGTVLPTADYMTMAVRMTSPNSALNWASSQRGKYIGSGQCTDLVSQYLAWAGARQADFRNYRFTIWGAIPMGGIRPGDIIQFELCKFRYTTQTGWYEKEMPHHTAIIVSVNGNVLQLLHQNAPIGGPVKLETLDLSKKTEGKHYFWRPVAF